jgi:hypothetical protein
VRLSDDSKDYSAATRLRLPGGPLIRKQAEPEGDRMSLLQGDYFEASLPGASQTVRIASLFDAKVFARRWVIRDKDPALKALLRHMEKVNSSASADSAIRELKDTLASRGMLITVAPVLNPVVPRP